MPNFLLVTCLEVERNSVHSQAFVSYCTCSSIVLVCLSDSPLILPHLLLFLFLSIAFSLSLSFPLFISSPLYCSPSYLPQNPHPASSVIKKPHCKVLSLTCLKVKVLYVRNLMLSTSEEAIEKYFNDLIPNSVERVKKIRDYAFVHFNNRENAVHAMGLSNGAFIYRHLGLDLVAARSSFEARNRDLVKSSSYG